MGFAPSAGDPQVPGVTKTHHEIKSPFTAATGQARGFLPHRPEDHADTVGSWLREAGPSFLDEVIKNPFGSMV